MSPGCVSCDKKDAAREFMHENFPNTIQHTFTNITDMSQTFGTCSLHPGLGRGAKCALPAIRPHLCSVGPPCQPWSALRQQNGESLKTQDAAKHPDYNILMDAVPKWLRERRPAMALIEETAGILKADRKTGVAAYEVLEAELLQIFPAVEVVRLNANIWSTIARERTVRLLGCSGLVFLFRFVRAAQAKLTARSRRCMVESPRNSVNSFMCETSSASASELSSQRCSASHTYFVE
jgi:hypothetical protein